MEVAHRERERREREEARRKRTEAIFKHQQKMLRLKMKQMEDAENKRIQKKEEEVYLKIIL